MQAARLLHEGGNGRRGSEGGKDETPREEGERRRGGAGKDERSEAIRWTPGAGERGSEIRRIEKGAPGPGALHKGGQGQPGRHGPSKAPKTSAGRQGRLTVRRGEFPPLPDACWTSRPRLVRRLLSSLSRGHWALWDPPPSLTPLNHAAAYGAAEGQEGATMPPPPEVLRLTTSSPTSVQCAPARKRKERLKNLPEMTHGTLRSWEPWC